MNARSVIWQAVCRVDDIAPLGARRIVRDHGPAVAVFRGADDRAMFVLGRVMARTPAPLPANNGHEIKATTTDDKAKRHVLFADIHQTSLP